MSLALEVVAIARLAGQAIMEIYADTGRWAVQEKADASPLTAADLAAHRIIEAALRELTPDIPLLSEESDERAVARRREWPRCWVVDPLDGTKEFLKRNGDFTVNIALVEGDEAVLGVVHAPDKGLSYYAQKGQGAFCLRNGQAEALRCRPLPEPGGVVLVASRHHIDPRADLLLPAVEREFGPYTLTNIGSAFKTCLIAEGKADCYPRFGPTMEWDTAAAQIILEEAGGALLSPSGERFRYNARNTLTNGSFIAVGDQPARWLSCWPPE